MIRTSNSLANRGRPSAYSGSSGDELHPMGHSGYSACEPDSTICPVARVRASTSTTTAPPACGQWPPRQSSGSSSSPAAHSAAASRHRSAPQCAPLPPASHATPRCPACSGGPAAAARPSCARWESAPDSWPPGGCSAKRVGSRMVSTYSSPTTGPTPRCVRKRRTSGRASASRSTARSSTAMCRFRPSSSTSRSARAVAAQGISSSPSNCSRPDLLHN